MPVAIGNMSEVMNVIFYTPNNLTEGSAIQFRENDDWSGFQILHDSQGNKLYFQAYEAGASTGNIMVFNRTSADVSINVNDLVRTSSTLTISDDGAASSLPSATLTPDTSFCKIDCQDPDGCNVDISESGAADGAELTIVNISANTVNISDSAGVTELAGNFAMGQWDSLSLIYVTDRWVEVSRSDN